MPPKKDSKKTAEKAKQKVVDDKTFGLKNKNKSAKVQRFVEEVKKQASGVNTRKSVRIFKSLILEMQIKMDSFTIFII
jgi:hypothetical protein